MTGAVPLLLLLCVVAAATVATRRAARSSPVVDSERLCAAARTTRRWRLTGLAAGVVVGLVFAQQGALGRELLLAVPLFALCVLAGVVVGELRVTAPRGAVRRAGLEVRRIRDYLPRRLGAAVASATAVLGLLMAVTTAAGSPDDLGRAGRTLARRCSAVMSSGTGPWPGSYYTVPLALVVLSGLLLAGVALHRVVRRPRQGEDLAGDDGLRLQAAEAVTAAFGLLVAVPLAGVSLVTAGALWRHTCPPAGSTVAVWALLLLVPALVGLTAWCAGILLAPATSDRPAATSAAAQP